MNHAHKPAKRLTWHSDVPALGGLRRHEQCSCGATRVTQVSTLADPGKGPWRPFRGLDETRHYRSAS